MFQIKAIFEIVLSNLPHYQVKRQKWVTTKSGWPMSCKNISGAAADDEIEISINLCLIRRT